MLVILGGMRGELFRREYLPSVECLTIVMNWHYFESDRVLPISLRPVMTLISNLWLTIQMLTAVHTASPGVRKKSTLRCYINHKRRETDMTRSDPTDTEI